MKLLGLSLRRMPGFKLKGFEYPQNLFGNGLNIIYGPNASGKTLSTLAVQGLLWPKRLDGFDPVSISGLFEEAGKTFEIELEGKFRRFHPEKEAHRWVNINAMPMFRKGERTPYEVYTTFDDITELIIGKNKVLP